MKADNLSAWTLPRTCSFGRCIDGYIHKLISEGGELWSVTYASNRGGHTEFLYGVNRDYILQDCKPQEDFHRASRLYVCEWFVQYIPLEEGKTFNYKSALTLQGRGLKRTALSQMSLAFRSSEDVALTDQYTYQVIGGRPYLVKGSLRSPAQRG